MDLTYLLDRALAAHSAAEAGQHIMFRLIAADGSRYLGVFRVSARVT